MLTLRRYLIHHAQNGALWALAPGCVTALAWVLFQWIGGAR